MQKKNYNFYVINSHVFFLGVLSYIEYSFFPLQNALTKNLIANFWPGSTKWNTPSAYPLHGIYPLAVYLITEFSACGRGLKVATSGSG